MTQNKRKMRKHELKKQAFLAGLTTMAVGAVALSSGHVQADEQVSSSNPSTDVSLVTRQEANQTISDIQSNPENQEQDRDTTDNQVQAENKEQAQATGNQVGQSSTDESQTGLESQEVSEAGTQAESATSPAQVTPIETEVNKEEVRPNQEENSTVKRASLSTTVVKPATASADSTYTLPVQGPISAGFNGYPGHGGIDFAVPEGTPVHAARDGVVKIAGANHPWMGWQGGNAVLIQHPDGVHTGYAHLSRIIVAVGQQVSQGQIIGYSGRTGLVTGPHLHFEMLPANPNFSNGYSGRIDPTSYIANAPFKASPTPTDNRSEVDKLAARTGRTISDGDYVIASTLDTNFGLDINDSNFQNGSNVQLSNNISDSRAIFNIHYLGDGYYKIIHKKSGKAVDAGDGGSKNGANIQLYDDNGSDYQKWIIKPSWNSNSFEIISKKSGLNVDITERNISNGTNIELYEKTTSGAQQFRFISLDNDAKRTIADGDYHIVSALDDNMVLDVPYNTSEDNTQVQIFTKKTDQNDNQIFKVKYLNNDYYSITTKTTNKMIDDTGNGAFNGNKISIITPNGSESQQWIIRASAINGFFEIVSKRKNQVLDVTGAKASPETKVQLYARNNTKSQAWKFVPVKKD